MNKTPTPEEVLQMHSRLEMDTIKKSYSWVISAMKEYASIKVIEHSQGYANAQSLGIDEDFNKDQQSIWDVCINEAIRKAKLSSTILPKEKVDEIINQLDSLKVNR